MQCPALVTVCRVNWDAAADALRAIRKTVFIDEQRVPVELEWDGIDAYCLHVLASSAAGEAIGTGRLLPDGHIGRMAVLEKWRGCGIGSRILTELIAAARERHHGVVELSAQTHALDFYRQHGFEVTSEEYLEAGIPHRAMRLAITPPRG